MNTPGQIKENWVRLRGRIKELTDRDIRIVAVTKYYPPEIYRHCLDAGITVIGENRIQELVSKNEAMPEERKQLKIHFIGPLQTNKIKFLPGNADCLDTVSSAETIKKINDRWSLAEKLPVLIQINCTDEEQKAGLHSNNFPEILELARLCQASPKAKLEGVMTMGPTPDGSYDFPDPGYSSHVKKAFSRAADIKSRLENELGQPLPRLSMGMSHDYEAAIECGSTEIRVGSMLFG